MTFPKQEPVTVQIEGRVNWSVARDEHDGHLFGVCRELNLMASGDDLNDFLQCANESVALLLQSLLKHGELESFLRNMGWRSVTPLPSRDVPARFVVLPFNVDRVHRDELLVRA